jgi:ArsR family transcriptional regulator, arsenate/arsenite/antimonite-responsive transcriptional repressor
VTEVSTNMKIAQILSELGNETRLALFQLLVRFGRQGLTVGQIQSSLKVPASTLAFHLKGLTNVGLVQQRRDGRSVICTAQLDVLNDAITVIQKDCCKGPDDETVCGSELAGQELQLVPRPAI